MTVWSLARDLTPLRDIRPCWLTRTMLLRLCVTLAVALLCATLWTQGLAPRGSLAVKALGTGVLAGAAGATLGGGIALIAVPLITLLLGFPLHLAVGTNLVAAFATYLTGVAQHRKRGNVRFRLALPLVGGAAIGAPVGALTSARLSEGLLAWTFTGLVLFVAAYTAVQILRPERRETRGFDLAETLGEERIHWIDRVARRVLGRKLGGVITVALTTPIEGTHNGRRYSIDRFTPIVIGAGVGFVSGLLGIGGGSLLTPLMTNALMIPAHLAVGSALVVGAGNALFGGVTHLVHGNVDLLAAAFLALGGIVGATVGSHFSDKLSDEHLQKLFVVLLVVVAATVAPVSYW